MTPYTASLQVIGKLMSKPDIAAFKTYHEYAKSLAEEIKFLLIYLPVHKHRDRVDAADVRQMSGIAKKLDKVKRDIAESELSGG